MTLFIPFGHSLVVHGHEDGFIAIFYFSHRVQSFEQEFDEFGFLFCVDDWKTVDNLGTLASHDAFFATDKPQKYPDLLPFAHHIVL